MHLHQLQDGETEVKTRAQPHDIRWAPKFPGRSPPRLQGGDAAAKEICTDSAYSQPGKPEAQDPGGGDLQLVVIRGQGATIIAAHC